jgi:hypothetical protein
VELQQRFLPVVVVVGLLLLEVTPPLIPAALEATERRHPSPGQHRPDLTLRGRMPTAAEGEAVASRLVALPVVVAVALV